MVKSVSKWTYVYITFKHTLNMTCRQDTSNQQDNMPHCDYLKVESDKCDTWDRSLNDYDNTCTKLFTTSCASAIDVYMVDTTHKKKKKP